MELQTTTVAYLCPSCGISVVEDINIFSLSGGKNISCHCGEFLHIKVTEDRKVVLSVPCLACPEPHTIRLSSASFFTRELFTVQCPYTALDICYIGQRDKVKNAMIENKKFLEETYAAEMGGEVEEDVLKEMYDRYVNPMVMNDLLVMLRDFIADGDVECDCGQIEKLRVDIANDHVLITCTGCGKSKELRAVTENDIAYLCELDKIVLK